MSLNMLSNTMGSLLLSQCSVSQSSETWSGLCCEQPCSALPPLAPILVFSATPQHGGGAPSWLSLVKRVSSRLQPSRRELLFDFQHRGHSNSRTMGLHQAFSLAPEVLRTFYSTPFTLHLSCLHSQYGTCKWISSMYCSKQCW